jgi:hypothetical protein
MSKLISLELLIEGRKTPNILRRCVFDVKSKDDSSDERAKLSRSFAICIKSLQSNSVLKPGTKDLTKEGAKKSSAKGHLKDNKKKIRSFEQSVIAARKND